MTLLLLFLVDIYCQDDNASDEPIETHHHVRTSKKTAPPKPQPAQTPFRPYSGDDTATKIRSGIATEENEGLIADAEGRLLVARIQGRGHKRVYSRHQHEELKRVIEVHSFYSGDISGDKVNVTFFLLT